LRTSVRISSLQAYDSVKASGVAVSQRNRVVAWIRAHPRCSRSDISEGTGVRLASVCGRVNELLKVGAIFERELDKEDAVSHKRVNTLEAMPVQHALNLEAA